MQKWLLLSCDSVRDSSSAVLSSFAAQISAQLRPLPLYFSARSGVAFA